MRADIITAIGEKWHRASEWRPANDPIAKTFHRLGMQLPGCTLIPGEDDCVAATGSGRIEPALAAVPSLTGTQAAASLRKAGARIVRRLFDVVRNLRMRFRERRMPLELDDHVPRDIGLTNVEYRFLPMSRATTDPDRSQNSGNLHDQPPSPLYVSSVAEFRKPEIVA